MKIRPRVRGRVLLLLGASIMLMMLAAPGGATAGTPAAFTTVNEGVDGAGHCQNGNPAVNCNIYDGKEFVWLNGGPAVAALGDGSYFFAVLDPSGQQDPNDGTGANLSSPNDAYTNRTFSVSGGVVSYSGSHDFDSNEIRLMPYDDTSNPGGVYILAICSLGSGYPVTPRDCKYDAFKVASGSTTQAEDLQIGKTANPSFTRTYRWGISKSVDKTLVKQVGGNASFTYGVTVTRSAPTDSGWQVAGTITVTNPNSFAITDDVSDQVNDPNATCAVTGGTNAVLVPGANEFAYTCTYSAAPASANETNTATVDWNGTIFDTPSSSASVDVDFAFDSPALVDDCAKVSDTNALTVVTGAAPDGSSVCATTSYTYTVTVPVPRFACQSYTNTASFVTDTTGSTGSDAKTVQVCGPAQTGALTMGFWQNKNGQAIITGQAKTGVCPSATWLRQLAPFQDLSATATCAQTATYVTNVIKAATCTTTGKTCNTMLKAQMLATALDVYFSSSALGGNKIGAPAPVGGVAIDLTKICKMIDGSGGTATCAGTFENSSSAFGGAASLTVSQMLAYAAGQSNVGGTTWYGQVKSTQVLAKDAFDAINNQVAFGA